MYSFPNLEQVCCSMSISNSCFLTCIQISREADQVVWFISREPEMPCGVILMCSSSHTWYPTSNCSICPCQETVGSRRARARCSSDSGLQPEWMDGCPVAELSFGELWVPSQGHAHPFQSLLCISLVLFPNTSWSHHFPLSVPSDLHPHSPL